MDNNQTASAQAPVSSSIAVEFVFNEDSKQLHAVLTPAASPSTVSINLLQKTLQAKGFADFDFPAEILTQVLNQMIRGKSGKLIIASRRDARINLSISEDKMLVILNSFAAAGGKSIDTDMLTSALEENGVNSDLCDNELMQRVYAEQTMQDLDLVHGKLPSHGTDTQFEALLGQGESVIGIIEAGTALLRRTPCTGGENGQNVLGEVLLAEAGKDIAFDSNFQGVSLDSQDDNLIIAAVKGLPVYSPNGVSIDSVLNLSEVDIKSGNIDYQGSVFISGDIAPGTEVRATGDITVKGTIENAHVMAGRNIIVSGGILGGESAPEDDGSKQLDNEQQRALIKTQLSAGGSISAKFISMIIANAGANIEVQEYINHSFIDAAGQLILGEKAGKGRLVGGECHANQGIVANELGTESGIRTLVFAGEALSLKKEHKRIDECRNTMTEDIFKLSMRISGIRKSLKGERPSAEKRQLMDEIIQQVNDLRDSINDETDVMEDIDEKMLSVDAVTVEIHKHIFANVELSINGESRRFISAATAGVYHRSEAKVVRRD
ncbi:MAG: hypothetical protein COC19_03715 [SAR86 cluster bacterium]|uniref:Flagellar Assembly Protein A N-terminal region domain-containing protein n=1 Tax=SAR86 cluster bacterium TaxID=2030880 RepID=A0A2A4MQ02_9GAMM|nr:MAG: hypothetical protein COC19_03715 [SAR86 cluster bacterium]